MQIKAGLKKEWLHFSRTFRFGGVLIAIFSFALVDPLMIWALQKLMELLMTSAEAADISIGDFNSIISALDIPFGEAMFSGVMSDLCSTAMLAVMLLLMSPCGGEQKKRATIIPACTGLGHFEYLIPKYILYPATVFVAGFASGCLGGAFSNLLFGGVDPGLIVLGSLMGAVYMTFSLVLYMSIGLFTSRPGLVTVIMYIGMPLVQTILVQLDMADYQPLTLRTLACGGIFVEGFDLSKNVGSIIVGILLSIVIGVLMFFLNLAVMKGKKINNQENKPEF